jgi:hypothetical protein
MVVVLVALGLGACASKGSIFRGDRQQSGSRRSSAARPQIGDEEGTLETDRFGVAEAMERDRRAHANEHSGQALKLDAFSHPACAPLTDEDRRACPLTAVRWSKTEIVEGGVELVGAAHRKLDRLHWMVTCHIVFGRTHPSADTCPLHVANVRALTRVKGSEVRLRILTEGRAQVEELRRRVKRLVR